MKTILYMDMSVNGIIARENDDTPWSKEIWKAYYSFVKARKNIILGRRTYEIMKSVDEFKKLNYPTVVVVSSDNYYEDETIKFVTSPKEAVRFMKKKGFKEIVIGGGSKLNASFLNDGLIDEVCIDIEPMLICKGIKLFSETNLEAKLKLLEARKLSKNVVRLRYKVIKKRNKNKKR